MFRGEHLTLKGERVCVDDLAQAQIFFNFQALGFFFLRSCEFFYPFNMPFIRLTDLARLVSYIFLKSPIPPSLKSQLVYPFDCERNTNKQILKIFKAVICNHGR